VRRISRAKLTPKTATALTGLAAKVKAAPDPSGEAKRLWRSKPPVIVVDLRRVLEAMASGRARCMYCEDSLGTDIEHFYPKAKYPRKAFSWTNYLLACSHCNSNDKRDQFPFHARRPALIDPTADDPAKHLVFLPSTGEFRALGPKGTKSIDVFGLNDAAPPRKLPEARRGTFLKLQLLLEDYDRCIASGDAQGAQLARQTARDEPFTAVLDWLVALAASPAAGSVLRRKVPGIVRRHGVAGWV
jgi:uncharacterized protein (TIGR02646 family)